MEKTYVKISSVFFLLFVLTACQLLRFKNYKKEQELFDKQTKLAERMGVSNKKYPYFPIDYLSREAIKPGMALDEVHKIVVEYEVVYNNNDNSEIYYYYSKDDNIAERVWVMYDRRNQYKVLKISGEDRNSDPFIVEGWSKGVLVPSMVVPKPSMGTPIPDWQGVPVMTGATEGMPTDIGYSYFVETPMEEAEKFYKETMEAAGWTLSKYDSEDGGYGGPTIMMEFQRGREKYDIDLVFLKPSNITAVDLIQMEP